MTSLLRISLTILLYLSAGLAIAIEKSENIITPALCNTSAIPTIKDNAFQDATSGFQWNYMEWWTFMTYDTQGVGFMVSVGRMIAADLIPLNVLKATAGFPSGDTHISFQKHVSIEFDASKEYLDVSIKGCRIKMTDTEGNKFSAVGETEDKTLAWDLSFERAGNATPFCLANGITLPEDSNIYWNSFLPSSVVNGTVSFNGTKYELVGAVGEQNHAHGRLYEGWMHWNWGQSWNTDSSVLIYLANLGIGMPAVGVLKIRTPTVEYNFYRNTTAPEFTLLEDFDGQPFPMRIHIKGDNGIATVTLSIETDLPCFSNPNQGAENLGMYDLELTPSEGSPIKVTQRGWIEYHGPSG